jgi:hypothetical protein
LDYAASDSASISGASAPVVPQLLIGSDRIVKRHQGIVDGQRIDALCLGRVPQSPKEPVLPAEGCGRRQVEVLRDRVHRLVREVAGDKECAVEWGQRCEQLADGPIEELLGDFQIASMRQRIDPRGRSPFMVGQPTGEFAADATMPLPEPRSSPSRC